MKKLISIILACAMLMSLFCIVPASADSINSWPYVFEDFEDLVNENYSIIYSDLQLNDPYYGIIKPLMKLLYEKLFDDLQKEDEKWGGFFHKSIACWRFLCL